ncbi:MAG: RNase H [Ruminococcaceae bacterium]|nr:RNase H [Oscillospiraceae bacterium]
MKYYAVRNGRKIGIFETWDQCKAQVDGFSGAEYKSFTKKEDAQNYLTGEDTVTSPSGTVAYVDGSYNIETCEFSYGAVIFTGEEMKTFSEKFSDPELASMRNVAGEIKGSEFVMRYCLENGISEVAIYYDYEGISAWAEGRWKTNKHGTIAYKEFYDEIKGKLKVSFVKVKGHSGDTYNDMADRLAKDALGIK